MTPSEKPEIPLIELALDSKSKIFIEIFIAIFLSVAYSSWPSRFMWWNQALPQIPLLQSLNKTRSCPEDETNWRIEDSVTQPWHSTSMRCLGRNMSSRLAYIVTCGGRWCADVNVLFFLDKFATYSPTLERKNACLSWSENSNQESGTGACDGRHLLCCAHAPRSPTRSKPLSLHSWRN